MQRIWRLNGENITYDYDFTSLDNALIEPGFIDWFEITDSKIQKWKALIKVKRDNKNIMINFESDEIINVDLSKNMKIFIEIEQEKIESWFTNNPDWSWIANIKIQENYPIINTFLKIAEIENSQIIDKREFIKIKENFNLTNQWNEFNEANQLVKLDENGELPELNASKLQIRNFSSEKFIAWEKIATKNPVYIKNNWEIAIATAKVQEKSDIIGFAKNSGEKWEEIEVIFSWKADIFDWLSVWKNYFLWDASENYWMKIIQNNTNHSLKDLNINYLNWTDSSKYLAQNFNITEKISLWKILLRLAKVWSLSFGIKVKIFKKSDNSLIAESTNIVNSSEIQTNFLNKEFIFSGESLDLWEYYIRIEDEKDAYSSTDVVLWATVNSAISWNNWYSMNNETSLNPLWENFEFIILDREVNWKISTSPGTIEKKIWISTSTNSIILKTV